MFPLRQSTAGQELPLGYFLDSTDGDTAETGLTIANTDIKLHKSGATSLADKNSGGATHMAGGLYYAVLDATDSNTVGPMVVFVKVSGALAVRIQCMVYEEAIYDALFASGATGALPATLVQGGINTAAGTITTLDGLDTAQDTQHSTTQSSISTAAQIADAVFDEPYADHTTAGTFGKLFDLLRKSNYAFDSTVSVSPTPTTSSFGTNLTQPDDNWNEQALLFVGGTLTGQVKPISDFANTNGVITVSEPFTAAPSSGDEFVIIPQHIHTVEAIREEIDSNSTKLTAIVGDTNELQTDWADGGRLELLLDAIPTDPGGLKKNTAVSNFMFFMALTSDHVSPATGKTVTAERSLDGAAFAACANSVTEVSDGMYKISLAAGDLNGDVVSLKFTAADSDDRLITIVTEP